MEVGCPHAPIPIERGIRRRQLCGELAELGRGGGRPARDRMLGAGVELRGDRLVRAFGRQGEVAGTLLDVLHRGGERSVHGAALPDGRAFVTDRAEQGMREADALVVELDHRLLDRSFQRLQHPLPLSVGRRHQLHRRPRESGHE